MATQAGLFSAVLTAFLIDSKQNLKAKPEDKMEYYFQQNNALLDQISRQISSIAPQLSIPSTPPAPFPDFSPSSSDIRVNVFWFMSLIFSLSAALIATLVQQWVRDYMHVFHRYSDPLKRARLRQYLVEGLGRSYMLVGAEAVPGLLHVSLFLFFLGLCDFIFNINTEVALSTATPIAIIGLLYIFTTVAPVINPQWPYRNSFSGLIWYAMQKFGRHQYKDRGPRGALKSLSSNIAGGQMQLAMAATKNRQERDLRAIRWLVSNVTEGVGMESFVMAILSLFNEEWGVGMWGEVLEDSNTSWNEPGPSRMQSIFHSLIPMVRSRTASDSRANSAPLALVPRPPRFYSHSTNAHTQGKDTLLELSARVGRLFDTCKDKGLFASDQLWRRRTRACVETTALLVCRLGAELHQFGDTVTLLGDIGSDQTVREASTVGNEQSFVMRWTCLSLVAIRHVLESESSLRMYAELASRELESKDHNSTAVEKIIHAFNQASNCLKPFSGLSIWRGDETEGRVEEILRRFDSQISELEQIDINNVGFQSHDLSISKVQQSIDRITHGIITRQSPGVKSDDSESESVDLDQYVELFRDPRALLFIFPLRNLCRIQTFAQTLRRILDGEKGVDTVQKTIKDLREFVSLSTWSIKPDQTDKLLHRQLWRLQDLSAGGLGFTVELFFLALKKLLSTPSSKESHPELYIGTFRAIAARGSDYSASPGTQKLLLDMVVPDWGIIFDFDYPDKVVTESLKFLGSILAGHTGDAHINDVVERLTSATRDAHKSRHCALSMQVLVALGFNQAGPSSS